MKSYEEKTKSIEQIIRSLEISKRVEVYRRWCRNADGDPDQIYKMEEFSDFCEDIGLKPLTVARYIYSGKFNPNNKYFRESWDVRGFESTDDPSSWIEEQIHDITEYVVEWEDDLENYKIELEIKNW